MVDNCIAGYNSCMFAYGQTGSGKTHTMLGDIDDLDSRPSSNRGMTPRVFEYLFARIRHVSSTASFRMPVENTGDHSAFDVRVLKPRCVCHSGGRIKEARAPEIPVQVFIPRNI